MQGGPARHCTLRGRLQTVEAVSPAVITPHRAGEAASARRPENRYLLVKRNNVPVSAAVLKWWPHAREFRRTRTKIAAQLLGGTRLARAATWPTCRRSPHKVTGEVRFFSLPLFG